MPRTLRLPAGKSLRTLVCLLVTCGVCILPGHAQSQPAGADTNTHPIVLTGGDERPAFSLNGAWHSIPDPYFAGLYDFHGHESKRGWFMNLQAKPGDPFPIDYNFAKSPVLHVPGDWNTQDPELFLYEGPMWYEKDFDYVVKPHSRVFLRVGAANYKSIFWVNGKRICDHTGGFTAFACEVTPALVNGHNFIVAVVDDTRHADGVPTLKTDWFNYGGLTREIGLIDLPQSFIDQYDLHLNRGDRSEVDGWVHVMDAKPGESVEVSIPELHANTTGTVDAQGRATISFHPAGLKLWSPESPTLYRVRLTAGTDSLQDEIGFRTIEVRGTEILLNGKPVFLRGVSIHAEAPYRTGRAYSYKDAAILLGWAKQLGCNYVRLAHYPHDEAMLHTADRLGLMVWAENPVYWALQFDNPAVYANAQNQLDEEINTSRNHASIILWSMANETPSYEVRTKFISALADHARALDPTRLITAALLVRSQGDTKIVDDPLGAALDVIGTNEYIGWYERHPEDIDKITWQIAYQKPLIMSEFGAGAKAGLHGGPDDRWTEEYQANVYQHQLVMLNRISQLRGMSPWVLMDFRSPVRVLPGIQDGFNRKGLISDQGQKKQAFFVLQKAYLDHTIGKAE